MRSLNFGIHYSRVINILFTQNALMWNNMCEVASEFIENNSTLIHILFCPVEPIETEISPIEVLGAIRGLLSARKAEKLKINLSQFMFEEILTSDEENFFFIIFISISNDWIKNL